MLKPFTKALVLIVVAVAGGCAFVPLQTPAREVPTEVRDTPPAAAEMTDPEGAPGVHGLAERSLVVVDTPNVRSRNTERFERAVGHLRAQEFEQAEALLEQITKDQPELAGPWLNLGRVQLKRGDLETARTSLEAAVEANGYNCPARTELGVLLRKLGEFSAARSQYEACLAVQPGFPGALLNLGILAELYLGDLPSALQAYENYLSVASDAEPRVKGWVMDLRRRLDA